MKRKNETASVIVEFIFVMPLLFVITLWSVELVNQLQYFNKAQTLSQYTAQYFFRECSTFRDIYMTDCAERIHGEMNQFATKISEGSHVEIRIIFNRDTNPMTYHVRGKWVVKYSSDSHDTIAQWSDAPWIAGGTEQKNSIRCQNIDEISITDITPTDTNNTELVDTIIVTQAYIKYSPIIAHIPLLGIGGGGSFDSNAEYICDQTII